MYQLLAYSNILASTVTKGRVAMSDAAKKLVSKNTYVVPALDLSHNFRLVKCAATTLGSVRIRSVRFKTSIAEN